MEAVQAVDLVGPDKEVEQSGDGRHDDEAGEHRAEEQHQGHGQGVAVERPTGEGTGPLSHQLAQPGTAASNKLTPPIPIGRYTSNRISSCMTA